MYFFIFFSTSLSFLFFLLFFHSFIFFPLKDSVVDPEGIEMSK
jgi:hypothetical protein